MLTMTVSEDTKKVLEMVLGEDYEELPQFKVAVELSGKKEVVVCNSIPVTLTAGQHGPCC